MWIDASLGKMFIHRYIVDGFNTKVILIAAPSITFQSNFISQHISTVSRWIERWTRLTQFCRSSDVFFLISICPGLNNISYLSTRSGTHHPSTPSLKWEQSAADQGWDLFLQRQKYMGNYQRIKTNWIIVRFCFLNIFQSICGARALCSEPIYCFRLYVNTA